jgi:hypothetical protein
MLAAKDKENSQNTATVGNKRPPPASVAKMSLPDTATLLGMTAKQLKEVMNQ